MGLTPSTRVNRTVFIQQDLRLTHMLNSNCLFNFLIVEMIFATSEKVPPVTWLSEDLLEHAP